MYTLSKGPSKIVAKTRRGLSSKLDNLEKYKEVDKKKEGVSPNEEMSSPKLVFHQINGKRAHSQKVPQEPLPPHHEDTVRFVYEAWSKISRELEHNSRQASEERSSVQYYVEKTPNPNLQTTKKRKKMMKQLSTNKRGMKKQRQRFQRKPRIVKLSAKDRPFKSVIEEYQAKVNADFTEKNLKIFEQLSQQKVQKKEMDKFLEYQQGRLAKNRTWKPAKEEPEKTVFTDEDFQKFEKDFFGSS